MKKPHTVNLDDMLEWMDHESATFAACSDARKMLEVRLCGGYRVTVRDQVVYDGTDGRSAVTAYNKIRD